MHSRTTGSQTVGNKMISGDTTQRSRGWLLAQQVLGRSIPAAAAEDADARRSRKQLEWLAGFSPKHERELRRRLIEESIEQPSRERRARGLQRFKKMAELYEGEWNADLHPRG